MLLVIMAFQFQVHPLGSNVGTLNAIYRTILHPIILCTHTSNLCLRYILLRFSQTSGLKMSTDKRSC